MSEIRRSIPAGTVTNTATAGQTVADQARSGQRGDVPSTASAGSARTIRLHSHEGSWGNHPKPAVRSSLLPLYVDLLELGNGTGLLFGVIRELVAGAAKCFV